jgi:hypothetical protein
MNEKPIIFSGPMVQAVLDGRKRQTRRIMADVFLACLDPEDPEDRHSIESGCPYGGVGDRLWVRETFAARNFGTEQPSVERRRRYVLYRADAPDNGKWSEDHWHDYGTGWTPSIFMPRWASRLTLEITGVSVERLQAISDEDARLEGVPKIYKTPRWLSGEAVKSYQLLWDSINGRRANWESNPWVWTLRFTPLLPTNAPVALSSLTSR